MNILKQLKTKQFDFIKGGFVVLLAIYGIVCASDVTEYRLLDRVDLIAHEAGHLLFGYFGRFIGVLGGTLGQLIVPIGIVIYFAAQRQRYSAAVVLFWVGQSLFNISVYVQDASRMVLPLVNVGGGEGMHDWNYLLRTMGLLRWDQVLGNLVFVAGLLIIAASVVAGFYLSFDEEQE